MLVLFGIAVACSAAVMPHITKFSVASKLVEVEHPVVCPPWWLPVLLMQQQQQQQAPIVQTQVLRFLAGGTVPLAPNRTAEPSQLDHAHPPRHEFVLSAHGKEFHVDAARNDLLFAPNYAEFVSLPGGGHAQVPAHEAASAPHRRCQYHSTVRPLLSLPLARGPERERPSPLRF